MAHTPALAEVLHHYMRQMPYACTPGLLGKLSAVPKATIVNWLEGRVARPRQWQDVIRVATVLRLNEDELNKLLQAAGHTPIAVLLAQSERADDRAVLAAWSATVRGILPPRAKPTAQLPVAATPLIGRKRETAAVRASLERADVRLLTLTGPGGIGKSRLALQVATECAEFFTDGVFFIPLAPLTDAALVATTIAQALGVTDVTSQSWARLTDYLRERHLLLILDNFEHVAAAAPLVAELIQATPQVTVLITSRSVLRLYGEHEFVVPPLTMPNAKQLPPIEQLIDYEAIKLFVQRTQAIDPAFSLSSDNAPVVAAICARLEGLPLSIELAAARGKLLDPPRLLARLADRLGLLTWGPAHIPARQQTLRNTLDWSYHLLDMPTQMLLAQIAVFMGGFTLEAAEAVCVADETKGIDEMWVRLRATQAIHHQATGAVADGLMTLLNNSLLDHVVGGDDAHRFVMLETIRQYAEERLVETGIAELVQRRHASYYVALAEAAAPALIGSAQVTWLMRLEEEHDNIRAALGRALAWPDAEVTGRLCSALWRFWMIHGHLSEGRMWIDAALIYQAIMPTALRANLLLGGGWLARQQGNLAQATGYLETSLALWRTLADQVGIAQVLGYLGVIAYDQGDFDRSQHLHQESLALRQHAGDHWGVAVALTNLGEVARQQGNEKRALELQSQSLALFRSSGDRMGEATALLNMGLLLSQTGESDRAHNLLRESLYVWQESGEQVFLAESLEALAGVAAATDQPERAARIGGAAETIRALIGAPLSASDRTRYEQSLKPARMQLDAAMFLRAWAAGQSLTIPQAIAEALHDEPRQR